MVWLARKNLAFISHLKKKKIIIKIKHGFNVSVPTIMGCRKLFLFF